MLTEIRYFFTKSPLLARLIGLNLIVFLGLNLIRLAMYLFNISGVFDELTRFLSVPSYLEALINRPWTVLTYAFVHLGIFHFVFNMIMLYVGGRLFEDFLGRKQLLATYVFGALTGALFFIAAFNIFPVFEPVRTQAIAIGASASVLAVFIAVASYAPDFKLPLLLIGPVKLKYIAIFIVVIDILSISRGNPGGHIAHLGGAFWGFLYAYMVRKQVDPAKALNRWVKGWKAALSGRPRMKVNYSATRPATDEDYNLQRAEKQREIDRILDKISQSGYDSLTAREKETLFKSS